MPTVRSERRNPSISRGTNLGTFSYRQRYRRNKGESLGETLERLVDEYSLMDFANDAAELELDGCVAEAVNGAVEAPAPRK
jgi:hypothetical protein